MARVDINEILAGMSSSEVEALRARFEAKVARPDGPNGCWVWTGSRSRKSPRHAGYGYIHLRDGMVRAHRLSLALDGAELSPESVVDHFLHCTTLCCNPAHLRQVTLKENAENRAGARKGSATGVRGVTVRENGKLRVVVGHAGKNYSGGTFEPDDLEGAAAAAASLRARLFSGQSPTRAA